LDRHAEEQTEELERVSVIANDREARGDASANAAAALHPHADFRREHERSVRNAAKGLTAGACQESHVGHSLGVGLVAKTKFRAALEEVELHAVLVVAADVADELDLAATATGDRRAPTGGHALCALFDLPQEVVPDGELDLRLSCRRLSGDKQSHCTCHCHEHTSNTHAYLLRKKPQAPIWTPSVLPTTYPCY